MSNPKYLLYAPLMKLLHKFGFHYAPGRPMPEPGKTKVGIDGKPVIENYHWCQWCGLRGSTVVIHPNTKENI